MSTGTELAHRPVGQMARTEYDQAQINVIRDTVAKGASEPELAVFLEVCARYQLDPFTKQIWCAKLGDGGGMAIMVGRDGMLAVANRHADYGGFDSDVVRENDDFSVDRDEEGKPVVTHIQKGHHRQRGEVVGAWCVVYRNGRRPRYFYAPLEDYMPSSPNAKTPWGKGQISVMIEKVAITTAHRLAFEITGVYADGELAKAMGDEKPSPVSDDEIEWPEDQQLADWLSELFLAANELVPGSWLPAKVKMVLAGKTEGQAEDLANELCDFIRTHGGEPPEKKEPEAELGEEPIEDAELVDLSEPEPVEPEVAEDGKLL